MDVSELATDMESFKFSFRKSIHDDDRLWLFHQYANPDGSLVAWLKFLQHGSSGIFIGYCIFGTSFILVFTEIS